MSWVTMTTVRAEAARGRRESAPGFLRRCGCRGCRSARRRGAPAGRPRARGRSRRAGARRPRARRAGGSGGDRAGRGRGVRARVRRPSSRGQPRRCSGRPTFSRHESVGSRLKNWKMKPILSRRTRVSASSDKIAERLAVDADLPGGRAIEAADEIEERGFAGAGGADDRDHLAARDGQADRVEGDDVALAGELLGDARPASIISATRRLCELFHNIVKFPELRRHTRPTGRGDQTPQVPPKPIVTCSPSTITGTARRPLLKPSMRCSPPGSSLR